MRLDPVTLEIMATKVAAVADEMGFTLQRTGRTLYVKETADFGTALVSPEGKFFAYPGAIGVSGFVDLDCAPTIAAVGGLDEGDVVITNHAYRSAGLSTHTPDFHVIRPVYVDGRLVCHAWAFLHSSDVGGRVPSSISPSNVEVFQEGLLLPPTKLVRRGVAAEEIFGVIAANSRTPDENVGDIKAMLAALAYAERRVHEIVAQHGVEEFLACQADLFAYSREKARAAFRRVPDGTYHFWDYLDDDLATIYPRRIRLALGVSDGTFALDFDGTDPQTLSAFNIPTLGTRHPWLSLRIVSLALTLDPSIPINAGILDNVTIRAPEGSLLNPRFPAATGVRHASAIRVDNVLVGALAQALPDVMTACGGGVVIPIVFAESDPATGASNVVVVEPAVGGMGARMGADGVDGRDSSIANLANNPIETIEAGASLRIVEYALRPDSGGAGEWRGGNGVAITFEVTSENATVLGRGMERFRFRPWGLAGGGAGQPARTILNGGRVGEREMGKIDAVALARGDRFTILTPGAGGFGDAFARPPETVAQDVRRGFVTAGVARTRYGVALDADGAVDAEATAILRATSPSPDVDAARQAYDEVFDDAASTALSRRLYGLPPGPANHRRGTILAAVLDGTDPGDLLALSAEDRRGRRARFADLVAQFTSEPSGA